LKKYSYLFFVLAFVFACSDSDDPKSSAKSITSFKFSSLTPEVAGIISESDKAITLSVPSGTSVTSLTPTIAVSDKATLSPASGVSLDFTNPVKYTVTAEDGSTQEYTVTVTILKSAAKAITSFKLSALTPEVVGSIDESGKKVSLTVPSGTSVTALVPTVTLSEKATVTPASGAAQDFTNAVKYTVTAEDGTKQEYTVTVAIAESTKSSASQITSLKFSALNPEVAATIDQDSKHITATVPNITNRTALVPTIVISEKATVSPESGVAQDFTKPVVYTVTAEDGTFQEYLVTVSLSTVVSFTVNPLSNTDFQQDAALFMTGTNFGNYANNKVILKNTSTNATTEIAAASSSSATILLFKIPADQPLGSYKITVYVGLESKTLPETITVGYHYPEVDDTDVTSVIRGHNIVITGNYFMASGNVVKLNRSSPAQNVVLEIISESTTSIEVKVPASMDPGIYTLTVTSNGKITNYTIEQITVQLDPDTPVIALLNAVNGTYVRGQTITVTGTHLDGVAPKIHFTVFISGTNTDGVLTVNGAGTSATYTIPMDFPTGTYVITVEADGLISEEYSDSILINP
jgi:hypothetical protein